MSIASDLSHISQTNSRPCPSNRCLRILKPVACPPCRAMSITMVGLMRCGSKEAWTHELGDEVKWDAFLKEDGWTIQVCDDCIAKGHEPHVPAPIPASSPAPSSFSSKESSSDSCHSRAIARSLAASALSGAAGSAADGEDGQVHTHYELFTAASESEDDHSESDYDNMGDGNDETMQQLYDLGMQDAGARTPSLLRSDASSASSSDGAEVVDNADDRCRVAAAKTEVHAETRSIYNPVSASSQQQRGYASIEDSESTYTGFESTLSRPRRREDLYRQAGIVNPWRVDPGANPDIPPETQHDDSDELSQHGDNEESTPYDDNDEFAQEMERELIQLMGSPRPDESAEPATTVEDTNLEMTNLWIEDPGSYTPELLRSPAFSISAGRDSLHLTDSISEDEPQSFPTLHTEGESEEEPESVPVDPRASQEEDQ